MFVSIQMTGLASSGFSSEVRMLKKGIFLLFVLIPLPLFAFELGIGIEAGYNYDIVNTATGWQNTKNTSGLGFNITVPVEFRITDWFSVNTGIRWIMRSSGYSKTYNDMFFYGSYTVTVDQYTKMHHALDFPFTVRFSISITNKYKLFIGGGAYVGVRTLDVNSGESQYMYSNPGSVNPNDKMHRFYEHMTFTADDNLFDAGLIAEFGGSYTFNDRGSVYIMGRYQYGLTSLVKDSYMAVHTWFDSICVDIGFVWRVL